MRRRTFLWTLAAAGGGAACRTRQPRHIVVAVPPHLSMAPVYLALEDGFFREANLDVEITQLAHSATILPALVGGRVDVALMALTAGLVNAVRRGGRVRLVAAREQISTACNSSGALLIRTAAFPGGLRELQELKGKRLAWPSSYAGGLLAFFGELLLEHAALTPEDVQLVDVRSDDRVAALARGVVDAALVLNDYTGLNRVKAGELAYVPAVSRFLTGFQYSFVQFGPRLLDGDPAVGTAFLTAYLRAVRAFAAGRTPSFVWDFARSNGLDDETLERWCRTSSSPDGAIDRRCVGQQLEWLERLGLVEGSGSVSDLIDTRFIDAASARLGQGVR